MDTLKQSEMLNLLKKHIQLALINKEGIYIKIEWNETDEERIKELRKWICE